MSITNVESYQKNLNWVMVIKVVSDTDSFQGVIAPKWWRPLTHIEI